MKQNNKTPNRKYEMIKNNQEIFKKCSMFGWYGPEIRMVNGDEANNVW